MNTIDQRILIPTPPEVVWDYLGDLTKTPEWQADCKAVSFLTSKRNGPGTRLRISGEKGQDRVVEITAWYDGLGYQYTYVDGVPYRESTGRIRLQEIPEGTVVQWTFTYEAGGIRIGLGRQIETAMETSLKSLWRQVSQSSGAQKIREAKSLMREAPDYEARAQYKPRHPTVIDGKTEDGSPAESDKKAAAQPSVPFAPPPQPEPVQTIRSPIIDEPPLAEEDTRPRRPVTASPAPMPDELFETTSEPDFIFRPPQSLSAGLPDELFETTAEPDFLEENARFAPPALITEPIADTQPIKPITAADLADRPTPDEAAQASGDDSLAPEIVESVADEPPVAFAPVVIESVIEEPVHSPDTDSASVEAGSEDLTAEPVQDVTVPVTATEALTQPVEPEPPRPVVTEQGADVTPTTRLPSREEISKLDTAKLSIWEIFGVQRPSDEPPAAPQPEPVAEVVAEPAAPEVIQPTDQREPVSADLSAAPATETAMPTVRSIRSYDLPGEHSSRRGGLRMRMRRKTVRLRYPE